VKALGVRKNLMRIIRKLRQLEQKLATQRKREHEARLAKLQLAGQLGSLSD